MALEMAGCSKRLKLDPDFLHEESEQRVGHILCRTINPLSSLVDVPVQVDEISLASLPKELIQEICMFLSVRDKMSLRLVNRQLYATISYNPHLWTNVAIDDAYRKINSSFVKSVLKTCQPHVQSLSLKGYLSFRQYQSIMLNCNNIHTLNLYGFEINFDALQKIFSATPSPLPHLQYLALPIYSKKCYELVGMQFSYFSQLKKLVVMIPSSRSSESLFESWLENKFLPPIFVIVSERCIFRRNIDWSKSTAPITESAQSFAKYFRYRRPLGFDFYDIPQYAVQLGGPNKTKTANGELVVMLRDIVTPTAQPNDDLSRKYAVFDGNNIDPSLPVYSSQLGNNVYMLNFAAVFVSLESFSSIVKETPNVLEVSFQGSTISDDVDAYMVPLSEHCLKLRGLNLSDIRTSEGTCNLRIDKEHFWLLLSKIKCLEFLSLDCNLILPPTIDLPSLLQQGGEEFNFSSNNMIDYIKSMSGLKALHIFGCHCSICRGKTKHLQLIHHFLLSIVSNLKFLKYLRVNFPLLDSGPTKGLEEVLQHCQQLSVLIIIGAKLTLPVDPSLYSSLTHFWLDCKDTLITSEFVTALAINSRKHLKHFVADLANSFDDRSSISKSDLIELVESCSFITLHFLNFPRKKYEDVYGQVSSVARKKFQYCSFGEMSSATKIHSENPDFTILHLWRSRFAE
uniref:F-box domain-containing protein n=1 Tax=Amphimedon queenslandica TaxID=400682 RepID=A0A1X7TXX9_AMPQE